MHLYYSSKRINWIIYNAVFLLFLMFVSRCCLYIFFKVELLSNILIFKTFLLGFRYDARYISILSLFIFLISSIKKLNPFIHFKVIKLYMFIYALALFFLVLFYTIDFANYAYLKQRINAQLLNFLDDARISFTMLKQTYPLGLMAFIILIIVVILTYFVYYLFKKNAFTKPEKINKKYFLQFVPVWLKNMIFIFVSVFFIYGKIDQYPLRWSDAFALGNNTASVIALNPMQSFFSSLSFIQAQFDAQKVTQYYGNFKEMYHLNNDNKELDYTNKIESCNNQLIPKNVVVIICESFSYYKSSVGNNHLNTTPFFKSLTKNGILFNRCFTPHIGTARGVWSILTNIPDVQLFKTATRNPAMVNQKLLLNNFTNNNFYFIGGSASWANIRGLLTNNIQNLQLFEGKDFNHPTEDVWGISDKNLLLEANKKLAQQTSPFTAIIQTADNHRPYTIPAEDKATFTLWNIDSKTLQENGFASNEELNAFRYVDFCIEHFMEAAKKEKYYNETIFVFVGDHGIAGNAGKQFPNAWTEGGLTANHVPLLFYAPKYLEPKQYNFLCSQLDVMPTIAGLLHKNVLYKGLGKNILSTSFLKNDTAQNTIFIIENENKKIGILQNNVYFSYKINSTNFEIRNILNNNPLQYIDTAQKKYFQKTETLYQTARYLLLNNGN